MSREERQGYAAAAANALAHAVATITDAVAISSVFILL
jgi:hypothetical protein